MYLLLPKQGAHESGKKQEPDTEGQKTKTEGNELPANGPAESAALAASLPCLDRLRQELSCAVSFFSAGTIFSQLISFSRFYLV